MTVADTSYVIDLMRGDAGARRHAEAFREEGWTLWTTTVTLHELHRGLAQVRRPDLEWNRMREVLAALPARGLDAEASRIAGQIDGALVARGEAISVEDCMIAGIALRHGEAVVTRNRKDFTRVQGLDVVAY